MRRKLMAIAFALAFLGGGLVTVSGTTAAAPAAVTTGAGTNYHDAGESRPE